MKNESLKSAEIENAYRIAMEKMYAGLDSFPWTEKIPYGAFLAQTYHMTKYTTRLAAATAGAFPLEEERQHRSGLVHLREETGHERLALNDLRGLGLDIKDFPEFEEVRAMILAQTHFIQRHPSAHFGFVLPLETMAASRGPRLCQVTRQAYEDKCNSFIRVHTEVDQHHVGEMIKLINAAPDWVSPFIAENIALTGHFYAAMLARASVWNAQKKQAA